MGSITVLGTNQAVDAYLISSLRGSRKNFSIILSQSKSSEESVTKKRTLARYVCDEHEWDNGRCDFRPIAHKLTR